MILSTMSYMTGVRWQSKYVACHQSASINPGRYNRITMAEPYLHAETLDDLMRSVFQQILCYGEQIKPSKGPARELAGMLLELENPRARLSRTQTRGKPLSCLGELCWYLAKRNDLSFIEYYIPEYVKYADEGVIYGGYGPRLFDWRGTNQFQNVVNRLADNRHSRRAVIQLYDGQDIVGKHTDIPCTCTLQFMVRGEEELSLIAHMRSNDAYKGLPHDIFCFTMLQEIMARKLSLEVGTYKHMVGSLHLYNDDVRKSERFLDEGLQATTTPMPSMPIGDPGPGISDLLRAEHAIRTDQGCDLECLAAMDPYWADLGRLLLVLKYSKQENLGGLQQILVALESPVYGVYIQDRINRLKQAVRQ